jgi:hypothetical protein
MQWLLLVLIGIFSFFIFYQDYKTRSIAWPLFFCILLLGILHSIYYGGSTQKLIINSILNICFFLLQILLLKILFGFKKIINRKIGTGDILFVLCCSPFFSPANFLVFYTLSLLFSLCFYFLLLNKSGTESSIPLAGSQAIFLFFFIAVYVVSGHNTTEDIFLFN